MSTFPLFPLWRITGTVALKTPLHIGSGRIAGIRLPERDGADTDRTVATVVRDVDDRPCIPGASFKGALGALARAADGLDTDWLHRLFGTELSATATQPAALELAYLHLAALPSATTGLPHADRPGHAHVAHLPHVARNRERGTAEDGLLFVQQVLPPGCSFRFEATLRGASPADVQRLLALLAWAGHSDSPLRLGSDKAADQGRIGWSAGTILRVATAADVWKLSAAAPAATDLWTSAAAMSQSLLQPDPSIKLATGRWLAMPPLTLCFYTPFLVDQATGTKPKGPQDNTAPDGTPRSNHAGIGILPASSLHGALRQQAERILRTMGQATPAGWQVPAVQGLAQAGKLDLASVLFGAAGWRSVLRITDFQVTKGQEMVHDMVAIDRITGGGKDHAKFRIRAYDCPELTGQIQVDLHRLRRLAEAGGAQALGRVQAALGLLARVLRDLDEGDIPLGYGASKGYGGCLAASLTPFNTALQALADPQWLPDVVDAAFIRLFTPGPGAALADSPAGSPTLTESQQPKAAAPATATRSAAAAPAGQFHNPYAFIPFGNLNTDPRLPWEPRTEATLQGHGHHRDATDRLHGRLVCRLQTRTPIFIGADDGNTPNGQPVNKLPFRLNAKRALPATSLRGLISSLHESITCSALRVLDNQGFSFRQQTGGTNVNTFGSSAIGRIVRPAGTPPDAPWQLELLTLPTLAAADRYAVPAAYASMVVDDDNGERTCYHKVLLETQHMRLPTTPCDFSRAQAHHFTGPEMRTHWYLPLSPIVLRQGNRGAVADFQRTRPRYKPVGRNDHAFLIGQRPEQDGAYPRSESEYTTLGRPPGWVRGFIRSMQAPDRELPGPNVRKYELFIPYPAELDEFDPVLWTCTPTCMDRFRTLADERTRARGERHETDPALWLPYAPMQTQRLREHLEPQHGDLVYFKAAIGDGKQPVIEEISYSAIWRGRVETPSETGPAVPYLAGAATSIPALDPARGRKHLSPSELIFGYVLEDAAPSAAADPLPERPAAFQSRVRIGHGRCEQDVALASEVTLKILASPKPPAPAMYFRRKQGQGADGITKEQLAATPKAFALKGRKAYLHAHRQDDKVSKLDAQGNFAQGQAGASPWASINFDPRANNQKLRITPIAEGNTFWFEVDFHNLTLAELQSLCASLQPFAGFEHKLGLGKPIGLGSVAIDVVRLQLVDRARRYLDTACGPAAVRHHHLWRHADVPDDQLLPQHLRSTEASCALPGMADPATLAAEQMAALARTSPGVHQALRLLGDPGQVVAPVHYPQRAGQPIETETYQWFVDNEKAGAPQALAALDQGSTALPLLTRTQQQPHRNPRR